MKIKAISMLISLMPIISACQGEELQIPDTPKRIFTVKASLPGSDSSRTHITYGNQAIDRELFRWHPYTKVYNDNDYISVFNITRLSECAEGIELNAVKVDGSTAEFESVDLGGVPEFQIKAGDLLLVNYWKTTNTTYGRNIFNIKNEPSTQLIVENPNDPDYMTYMKGDLKMYDIVTAVEDDKIPDIHFRYLSAIMRVTLRNETGRDFYPKTLQFKTIGGKDPFCPGSIYFSVDQEAADGSGLKVYNYDSNEGPGELDGVPSYTDSVKVDINNYTAAETYTGTFIAPGKSYDLYLPVVPRVMNSIESKTLIISIEERTASDDGNFFKMTLDGFNTIIKAGKRYWFNLTAVEEAGEYKLVFTNEWLDQHPDLKPDNNE